MQPDVLLIAECFFLFTAGSGILALGTGALMLSLFPFFSIRINHSVVIEPLPKSPITISLFNHAEK